MKLAYTASKEHFPVCAFFFTSLLTHVPHRWKKVTSFSGHLCGYNASSHSLSLRGWTVALQPQWCPKCRNPVWRSCLFKIKAWIRCLSPGAVSSLPLPLHLEHHRLRVLLLLVDVAYNFPSSHIKREMDRVKPGKAPGPDEISPRLRKTCLARLCRILAHLFIWSCPTTTTTEAPMTRFPVEFAVLWFSRSR